MSTATTPQTVSFELVVRFDHIENIVDGNREKRFECEQFEEMLTIMNRERRRRRRADRATSARYRMVLTDLGRERVAECEYNAKSHADAINGTWFNW